MASKNNQGGQNPNGQTEAEKQEAAADGAKGAKELGAADIADGRAYIAQNAAMKGRRIYGVNGDVMEFNGNGCATVGAADARHMLLIPGFKIKEK